MTDIVDRLREACVGHPHAKIAWPHRLLHEAAAEIEALRAALANETEACAAIASRWGTDLRNHNAARVAGSKIASEITSRLSEVKQ